MRLLYIFFVRGAKFPSTLPDIECLIRFLPL